jgi:hypothetical protein
VIKLDRSTIDWGEVAELAQEGRRNPFVLRCTPDTLSIGSCCFLDAPGFPSHFLFASYSWDNTTYWLVDGDNTGYRLPIADASLADRDTILRRCWIPLPYDSERVQIWVKHVYQYFARCWRNPDLPEPECWHADKLMIARFGNPFENAAYHWVHKFYPEHQPLIEYVYYPPSTLQEEWIDVYDHRPEPGECPGHLDTPHG